MGSVGDGSGLSLVVAVRTRSLVRFRIPDRYTRADWEGLLAKFREVFHDAAFPGHRGLE